MCAFMMGVVITGLLRVFRLKLTNIRQHAFSIMGETRSLVARERQEVSRSRGEGRDLSNVASAACE